MIEAAPAPKKMVMKPMTFVVYFDYDSAKPDAISGRTLGKVMMAISHMKPKAVKITGSRSSLSID